jgi:hypothetical protein
MQKRIRGMSEMKKRGRMMPWMLLSAFTLTFFWSSCTSDEVFQGPTKVRAIFKLKSPSSMNGKIAVREVYLKLSHIEATGSIGEETNTHVTHTIPAEEPPFQLSRADSSQAYFTLPARAYDQLVFHLFFHQDAYDLVLLRQPAGVDADTGNDHDGNEEDTEGGEQDDPDENAENGDAGNDEGAGDNRDEDDEDEDEGDEEGEKDEDGEDKEDNKDKDKNKNKNKNKGKGKDKGNKGGKNGNDGDGRALNPGDSYSVDLDHFFQNTKPGLLVTATYENNGQTLHIIFVAGGIPNLSIRGKQNDGFTIMLAEQNTAEITFDPERWFGDLTPSEIETGVIQTYQQQPVLFIHKDFNIPLFEALMLKIQESADLNFTPAVETTYP